MAPATGKRTLLAVAVAMCILQASPAAGFTGAPFTRPQNSRGMGTTSTSRTAKANTKDKSPTAGATSTSPSGTSRIFGTGRRGWELSASFDTLEEAMAYAEVSEGAGGDSEEEDKEDKGGAKEAPAKQSAAGKKKTAATSVAKKPAAVQKEEPKQAAKREATSETKTDKPAVAAAKPAPAKAKAAPAKPAAKKSGGGAWEDGPGGFGLTKAKSKPAASPAAAPKVEASKDKPSKVEEEASKGKPDDAGDAPSSKSEAAIAKADEDTPKEDKKGASKEEDAVEEAPKEDAAEVKAKEEEAKKVEEAKKAEDAKKEEDAKQVEEAKKEEDAKKAEEAKKAEDAKKEEDAKKAEEAKKEEDAKKAEEDKKAEDAKKEQEAKKEEEAKKVEEAKKAEDAKKEEDAKKADEDKKAEEDKTEEPKKEEEAKKEEPKKEEPKTEEPKKAAVAGDAAEDDKAVKDVKKPVKKKATGGWSLFGKKKTEPTSSLTLSKPETIVVVTGATGRVGALAVRRLLELYPKVLVRAVVNDFSKGSRLLKEEKDDYGIKLEIVSSDLSSMRSAAKAVEGASAVVFCASGYAQNLSPLQRLANAVRLTLNPSSVTDVEGVRDVALALKATKKIVPKERAEAAKNKSTGKGGKDGKEEDTEPQPLTPNAPRFVLLSSAAVTRPNWSNEDKAAYPLAAEVPIVKLNPLNILTVKAEGEKELREAGIPYAVVRPCGLNDDHPRGRPLFSVGDTAAGRICREDVADVLARCLAIPEATGKTFEVQSLPGLDKVPSSDKAKAGIDRALAGLPTDEVLEADPEMIKTIRRSTYPVLTQLRPIPMAGVVQRD